MRSYEDARVVASTGDPRSAMSRARRHQALNAEIERRRAAAAAFELVQPGPDDIGYQWRREQLDELDDYPAHQEGTTLR